jgi:hypothetical protein
MNSHSTRPPKPHNPLSTFRGEPHVHPFAGKKRISHAPLFPGRRAGNTTSDDVSQFDWAKPIVVDNLYHNYFQPASRALALGAVRFHDLRHTFATLACARGSTTCRCRKGLVATHNFDLMAARDVGFRTAFVHRPDEWGSAGPPDPVPDPAHDIVAAQFLDLAEQLGA